MKKKWVKINCYQIYTPKLNTNNNEYHEKRFDLNEFESYLNQVISLDTLKRGMDLGNKIIALESIKDSEDSDFLEGYFVSAKYGQVTDLIHRKTLVRRKSNKTIDEGDENRVYFIIEKKSGKLFLQSDSLRIVIKNAIVNYLIANLSIFEGEIKKLNIQNKPIMITPKNFFIIKTIYSDDFFEEIKRLMRIKKATFQINYDVDVNNDVIQAMRNQSENVEGADRFEYSIMNKERGGSIRKINAIFDHLESLDKYENIIVEGPSFSGKTKSIKLEDYPKNFDVQVEVNNNGIISEQGLINGIIEVAKKGFN